MKLRYIVITCLILGITYGLYNNFNQEEKIIRENIAREVKLQAELSGKIIKAENTIKELTIAISGDIAKIEASIEVVNAYSKVQSIKGYNSIGAVATTGQEIIGASGGSDEQLQAPTKNVLRHCQQIKDGELVTDSEGNGILETPYTGTMEGYEFVEDCGAFTDKDGKPIRGCYLRATDNSNCFAE